MSWELQNNLDSKREIREVYGNTLESMIKEGKDIMVCDSDLVGSSGAGKIFETYKENSVNFGICEQNMIAAAASMSVMGYKPFVHSFSPFVSRRVMDQVYVSAGFSKNDLHIYASEPGFWSQYNGATHTTFEDFAIMRSIPEITVVSPSDPVTFAWVMRYYAEHGGVFYNRCTRRNIPMIYKEGSTFAYGKSNLIMEGSDVLIIAEGSMVADALEAAKRLKDRGISVGVIDLLFIKPLDKELIDQEVRKYKLVISVENHNIYGGIGEAIGAELALRHADCEFRRLGVHDRYGQVGTVDYLKNIYQISSEHIVKTALEYVEHHE